MSKGIMIAGVIIGFIALVGLMVFGWVTGSYNSMVKQNEVVDTEWAKVESQYQRRFDLVPNLVAATRGYLKQEEKVFTAIAEARTRYAGSAAGSDEKVQATNQYEGALARLLVVMENYPELKSIQTVTALTDELAGTENRILVARDRYNEQVRIYNTDIKQFPRSFLAGIFGFKERTLFESVDGSEKAPVVNLE